MPFTTLNMPVWNLGGISGGILIATIAVVHVFVSHFAVGGGFYLVAAEYKGLKENSPSILKWTHKHTKFFLLVTMVFGSMTGVGIWLIISLISPAGISLLIREFLYAWAAEWIFFLGEIITLLLYVISFSRLRRGYINPQAHMALGAGYALFAFLSLVIINGVITFMLTPGEWIHNRSFWSALFNPTFWPSLIFRSSLALIFAGIFGLFTAVTSDDDEVKSTMVKFSAKWITIPFVGLLVGGLWYLNALPEPAQLSMHRGTKDITPYIKSFLIIAPILFFAGLMLFILAPKKVGKLTAIAMIILGLMSIGSFEWVRETTRRPWLVYGFMYSNGISVHDGIKINKEGFYANSGWSRMIAGHNNNDIPPPNNKRSIEDLTPEEQARFSHFMFKAQCSNCHGINAPKLDIVERIKNRGPEGIAALLGGQGTITPYMPPVFGTAMEREALAKWLAGLPGVTNDK